MIVDVIQKRVAQREVLGFYLVERTEILRLVQACAPVPDVVGFDLHLPRQLILDPEVPVLDHRVLGEVWHVPGDVRAILLRRIRVGQHVGETAIRVVPVVARVLAEPAVAVGDNRVAPIETVPVTVGPPVLDRRGVVDAIAAADNHLVALARGPGEPDARGKLLVVRIGESPLAAAALTVPEHGQSSEIAIGARIGQGRIQARLALADLGERRRDIPAEAEVERQVAADLPVVLHIEAEHPGASPLRHQRNTQAGRPYLAEQEGRRR